MALIVASSTAGCLGEKYLDKLTGENSDDHKDRKCDEKCLKKCMETEEYTEEEYLELDTSYHEFLVDNGYEPDEELLGRKIFSDSMRAALPAEFQMASFFANRAEAFIKEKKDNSFVIALKEFQ